jgi:ubiquinone/menaquinone biosynthesis C-methylase UbiE
MNDSISYHLDELRIAQDPEDPFHTMPVFLKNERFILDIGCGIGQTLAAANPPKSTIALGIDIDFECLAYGAQKFPDIRFVQAAAENIPFKQSTVDYVFSRVAVPFTDIPGSIASISRILCDGGKLWLELHPVKMTLEYTYKMMAQRSFKTLLYMAYVFTNGVLFHLSGRMFRLPFGRKKIESFQTAGRMRKMLTTLGFTDIVFEKRHSLLLTAVKKQTGKKVS